MIRCKNLCERFKVLPTPFLPRYSRGYRRCSVCEIWLIYQGKFCPCCGGQLKTKPRHSKHRRRTEMRVAVT